MHVREAEFKDIKSIVGLLEKAHDEFGKDSVPFCPDTTRNTMQRAINQREHAVFVLIENHRLVGVLVGLCNPGWYTKKRVISDLIYYVDEEHRGHGKRLLVSFKAWAERTKNVGVITLGITSGFDTERTEKMLNLFGFEKEGGYYSSYPGEIEYEQSA